VTAVPDTIMALPPLDRFGLPSLNFASMTSP
jgi:hypothetical protein